MLSEESVFVCHFLIHVACGSCNRYTLFSQGPSIKPALHGPIALLSLQKPSGIPQT